MYQPLEQFNIYILHELSLLGLGTFSLTNYWLVCVFLFLLVILFLVFPLINRSFLTNSWTAIHEGLYSFLVKLFSQHVNNYHSLYYFPIVSTIFVIVLFANLLGLMPYNFTITSHIFTTLILSLTMFTGTIIISLYYNKLNYFKFFVPKGIDNKPLKFFLVFIEIISYIIRPFSLAIRLFANMLAGHTLLYILNTFFICNLKENICTFFTSDDYNIYGIYAWICYSFYTGLRVYYFVSNLY